MAITVSNIPICSVPVSTDYFINTLTYTGNDSRNYFSSLATDIYDAAGDDAYITIFENDILRIDAKAQRNPYGSRPHTDYIRFWDKANNRAEREEYVGNFRHCYMALGFDDSQQKACWFMAGQFYYTGDWDYDNVYNGYFGIGASGTETRMYELISGSQINNWQSVPSLTGKGKTINLSTLNDVNDGEEVITDDTSKFDKSKENSLYTLISEQL